MKNEYRALPSVDKLLADKRVMKLEKEFPHSLILETARNELDAARRRIAAGKDGLSFENIVESIKNRIRSLENSSLRPVINAAGVILHTNLGRAPLSADTIAAMQRISRGYSNLEFDIETGSRGSRTSHIEPLIQQLTGAEAALVVNNNAAAVLLVLTALAKRREVIISRSEAVEIGGGFRIPDVMLQSGAKLVEVGTTNRTYLADYETAITERTAALMHVHSSNFKVVGFTHTVALNELAKLAEQHNIPLLDDQGSGCLLDTTAFGLAAEPLVQNSIKDGCNLVLFSGDKLLGGPQAGIIAGKKALVDKLKKHPLLRAIRADKTRLAGLHATLLHYLKGEAPEKIPVWRMISLPLAEIESRARRWAEAAGGNAAVIDGETEVGGGSLPGSTLPTKLVAIKASGASSARALYKKLASFNPPVIARISENSVLLDPRTVLPEEDGAVVRGIAGIG